MEYCTAWASPQTRRRRPAPWRTAPGRRPTALDCTTPPSVSSTALPRWLQVHTEVAGQVAHLLRGGRVGRQDQRVPRVHEVQDGLRVQGASEACVCVHICSFLRGQQLKLSYRGRDCLTGGVAGMIRVEGARKSKPPLHLMNPVKPLSPGRL